MDLAQLAMRDSMHSELSKNFSFNSAWTNLFLCNLCIYIHTYIPITIKQFLTNSPFSLNSPMAGLFSTLRPTTISSSFSNSQSSSVFVSRLLYLLTILSLSLAVFAFVLQWRGGLPDPSSRWIPEDDPNELPAVAWSKPVRLSSSSSSGCEDILGQSNTLSFPYFRDWKFNFGSSSYGPDLRPKVRFCPLFCWLFLSFVIDDFMLKYWLNLY